MPIYEYQCSSCGEVFDLLQPVGGPDPAGSPCCGAPVRRAISVPARSPSLMPRAAGKTCCGRDERCDTPPCTGGRSCCHG